MPDWRGFFSLDSVGFFALASAPSTPLISGTSLTRFFFLPPVFSEIVSDAVSFFSDPDGCLVLLAPVAKFHK